MKANEFVKKYGIAEAKALVNAQSWTMRQIALSTTVDTKELTELVKSHELVESKGGLIKAKEILADNPVWCFGSIRYSSPLEQAILDVESYHVD